MHDPSAVAPPKSSRRRNLLIACLLATVLVLGGLIAVHAASGSHARSHGTTGRHHSARAGHRTGHKSKVTRRRAGARGGHSKTHRAPKHSHPRPRTPLQIYASTLTPVVDRSRSAFDSATAQVEGSGDLSSQGDLCATWAQTLVTLADTADGVPHPYAWYTRVAHLHFDLMGVYHQMLGGLNQCNTASGNEDYDAMQIAIGDIDGADRAMRAMDDRVHSAVH